MPTVRTFVKRLVLCLGLASTAQAQMVVPVVGYTSPTNIFFEGQAIGDGAGTLNLVTSTGHKCEGRWRYTTSVKGVAQASCSDGRTMRVEFYAQDPSTGTSISKGKTSLDEDVVAFAGKNADRFMASRPEKPVRKLVGSGTGFAISADGYLMTNQHVIAGCERVSGEHNAKPFEATVVASDAKVDLALLKIPLPTPKFAQVSRTIRIGDAVYALGFPLPGSFNSDFVFQSGIVAADTGLINGVIDGQHLLQHSAPLNPGNSGGPLLNEHGHVVGVNVSGLGTNRAIGVLSQQYFAVNIRSLLEFVLSAMGRDDVLRPPKVQGKALQPAAIFDKAKQFTMQLNCEKSS